MTSDAGPDALLDALVRSSFLVMGVLTRIGAEHDLSLTQLRVLGILRDRRARMSELAAYLGLDKSTMSGLIDRAERRGLLARGKNPSDGRAVDVFMTPAGLELTERVEDAVRRALAPATGRLAPPERDQLTQLLELVLLPAADARPH
ncbi:MarR family winged helix-turn-helix transcriptional regulator [Cryptosporangium aurantiacum]|uniref:DNA-binding transcriptional regulator, MarR family n=1 Tax=Cryptosporangium aurantiacum TaxID=134849 RepID=A0A1M7R3E3_9ACTN|nr:MarR family transcriptional regulator [Cryptosporangium aurantiacum]SHN39188.1 DNA-binding transcriptional regulator, MarR family [Cryptosporangium aurantiacum]